MNSLSLSIGVGLTAPSAWSGGSPSVTTGLLWQDGDYLLIGGTDILLYA